VRCERPVAGARQMARQTGYFVAQSALEEDVVALDREAAEDLELGVGGVAAEDGREGMGVSRGGPKLAEGRIERVGRELGGAEQHRIPEGFEHDHVQVACGAGVRRPSPDRSGRRRRVVRVPLRPRRASGRARAGRGCARPPAGAAKGDPRASKLPRWFQTEFPNCLSSARLAGSGKATSSATASVTTPRLTQDQARRQAIIHQSRIAGTATMSAAPRAAIRRAAETCSWRRRNRPASGDRPGSTS
jgi:hypothetical protein